VAQFRYFMVRVRDAIDAPVVGDDQLTGIIERLAGGEKRSFADTAELIRLMARWPDTGPNMETVLEPRNHIDSSPR
jgi:hypothetical protein